MGLTEREATVGGGEGSAFGHLEASRSHSGSEWPLDLSCLSRFLIVSGMNSFRASWHRCAAGDQTTVNSQQAPFFLSLKKGAVIYY